MKVTHISIEFGATQNIGDYSNVKPSVVIGADLEDGDDPKKVLASLKDQALTTIHGLVDDELEKVGQAPRYYNGPLLRIWKSEIRKCIVLAPQNVATPHETTWKDRDNWNYVHGNNGILHNLRLQTATQIWKTISVPEGFTKVDCSKGDFSILPGLPDVGPEPAWHSKNLSGYFNTFHIDESRWVELGELEYLDKDYCRRLQDVSWRDPGQFPKDVISFILENRNLDQLFPPEPDPAPNYDQDEDYDDEQDDDDRD